MGDKVSTQPFQRSILILGAISEHRGYRISDADNDGGRERDRHSGQPGRQFPGDPLESERRRFVIKRLEISSRRYATILQIKDPVAVSNGGQTVSNNDLGFSSQIRVHR